MLSTRRSRFFRFAFIFLFSASSSASGTFQELFKIAAETNLDYSMFKIDLELAELRRGKGEIEAKVELDRLNAQSAYITAQADHRKSILGFFNEVIDAVYSAASTELDAASAGLKLENAKENKKYAEQRYKTGLLSEEGLKEADIALKTAATDHELSAWTFQDAKDGFRLVAGIEWRTDLLPAVPAFKPEGSVENYLENDTALRKARISEKIAALKTAGLAANAPSFDRKIQETESLKAKAAATGAESDARRSYESAIKTLGNQLALLQIRSEENELKAATYMDALRQYGNGMISLSEKNTQQISVLTAQKSLLSAQKTYLKSIGSYLSAMDKDPLGM